ncbi:tripartite tricarboxylate transporter permease [Candidatus Woesearchaeota archaeon]|nr:tripartite tricarboxylate transporter permease [Candidatus Woesearchaeota archaeon]
MIIEIIIAVIIGIGAGIFTGLSPGIHINLVSVLLLSLSPLLLQFTTPLILACFIISMSVTQTFIDPIPATFLGAPESESALGVLPGHRYLLKGMGYTAVKLTVIGSIGAMILSIIMFPFLIPFVKHIYPILQGYMGYILLGVVIFMILREKKKMWAIIIFGLSGILGLIVMNYSFKDPLFPLFSGLYGISTLLISLNENEKIPKQKDKQELKLDTWQTTKALLSGQFSGFITAVFPGLGAATAAVISMQITRKLGDQGFMILIGSISTVNFVLSLVAFYAIDKARNGSIIAVQKLMPEISIPIIIVYLCCGLIAGSISVYLCLKITRWFSTAITKVNYRAVVLGVIGLIIILVCVLTRWQGLLILFVGTCIGLIPAIVKTSRTHAMGSLLLPVMCYFLL